MPPAPRSSEPFGTDNFGTAPARYPKAVARRAAPPAALAAPGATVVAMPVPLSGHSKPCSPAVRGFPFDVFPLTAAVATGSDDDVNVEQPTPSLCRLSLLALIGSGIAFSALSAASQLLVHHGYSPFQVTFIRALGLTSFTLAQLSRDGDVPIPRDRTTGKFVALGYCFLYGIMACFEFGAVFIALKWLPLTEVMALWSLNPLAAAATARVCLGEPVNVVHGVGVLVFVGGAICAMDPVTTFSGGAGTSDEIWVGRGLAIVGAILAGCRLVVPRHMYAVGEVNCLAMPFWMGFMGLLLPGVTSLFMEFKSDVGADWWLYLAVLATAISAILAQCFLAYAMPREPAVVTGVLWNLCAVFSLVWQPVVFGIPPTLFQYISVVLVLAGGAIVGTEQQLMRKLASCCPGMFETPSEGLPSTDLTRVQSPSA